jgi:hypothetical protein
MKPRSAWMMLAMCALALSLAIAARLRASAQADSRDVDAPARAPVRELVSAVPFRLEIPFVHAWRREKPSVRAGYLLVLSVDPEYVRPRETPEPVLYAGDQTLERVNHGDRSGRVIVILPTESDAHGDPALDLAQVPFWFGASDLPERVDAAEIRAQRARAPASALRRFRGDELRAALDRGGAELVLVRREDLDALAGALVLEHAPDERDLADGLLVPPMK